MNYFKVFTFLSIVTVGILLGAAKAHAASPIIGEDKTSLARNYIGKNYFIDMGTGIGSPEDYHDLMTLLQFARSEDVITFQMHNVGGQADTLSMLQNALKKTAAQTVVVVDGPSYSAGAMFACYPSVFKMDDSSFLMFHNGAIAISGKRSDSISYIEADKIQQRQLFQPCINKHILTEEQVNAITKGQDIYLFRDDLIKSGAIPGP